MSNAVFPSSLPGMAIKVSREPIYATKILQTLARKELRSTWESYPRYRYKVDFNILRSDLPAVARARELQQLFTHIARHLAGWDSFLFIDPDDSSVTDHGFAAGDGVTTAFQVQRTLAGDIIDAAGFEYQAQTKPYLNIAKNSSFETDTNADGQADNWATYTNSGATEPMTAVIVPGVNGGKAQRVSWGTANTTTKGVQQSTSSSPAWVTGQWYTISFLVRGFFQSGAPAAYLGLGWNTAPSTQIVSSNPAVSTAWQRYVFQVFWNNGTSPTAEMYLTVRLNPDGTGNGPAIFGDLDFDDVLVVAGQYSAATLPQPNATPAAATGTRTPAYWPAVGDGFEPVYDVNGDAVFYEDGTWRGRRQLYPFVRTNLQPFSEQFDNAAYVKTNVVVTANSTTAPDGTATGDTISEGAVATAQHHLYQVPTIQEVVGELRCCAVFVKANNLPNIRWEMGGDNEGINFNLSTGVVAGVNGASVVASGVITDPRWPGWYRIWFIRRTAVATTFGPLLRCCADATYSAANYTGTSRTFFAWGETCERVSNLNGPTPYIPTPAGAAVTVTDYTLSSTGLFTPASVPPASAYFSVDMNYYRRVRFENDNYNADRLCLAMWEAKSVTLLSVKP